jgi:hypothetical protein
MASKYHDVHTEFHKNWTVHKKCGTKKRNFQQASIIKEISGNERTKNVSNTLYENMQQNIASVDRLLKILPK